LYASNNYSHSFTNASPPKKRKKEKEKEKEKRKRKKKKKIDSEISLSNVFCTQILIIIIIAYEMLYMQGWPLDLASYAMTTTLKCIL